MSTRRSMSQREIAEILWKSNVPELQGITPDQMILIFEEADKIVNKALYQYRKQVQDGLSAASATALTQSEGQKSALQGQETSVNVGTGASAAPLISTQRGVKTTSDGKPYDETLSPEELAKAPKAIDPATGQHGSYWVLSEEERAKGFVRPVRLSYKHRKCGTITSMSARIAETYARQPAFYSRTFCCACRDHLPVSEFDWLDGTVLGS